jgi:hypothetical protein
MLYEFSDALRQIEMDRLDETRLSAGVVTLDALKEGLAARVGFGAALIEECEKTDARFRSAVEIGDGRLFAVVSCGTSQTSTARGTASACL